MKDVYITKADPTGEDEVESVVIHISLANPKRSTDWDYVSKAYEAFDAEGAKLAQALWSALPGGTMDALLRHLLARRATILRVPFDAGVHGGATEADVLAALDDLRREVRVAEWYWRLRGEGDGS